MNSPRHCHEQSPESLMAYLYDECEAGERQRVEAHLTTCALCAAEVESLQAVRGTLETWSPPDAVLGFRVVAEPDSSAPWWRSLLAPSWGLATAAMVVLVVGAAIASVEIRYDASGFAFRMGWSDSSTPTEPLARVQTPAVSEATENATTTSFDRPWAADLASLENQLRAELIQQPPGGTVEPPRPVRTVADRDEALLLEQVRGLITDSERRQQQELALWFTQFAQEFDMQRRADQQRVQDEIGALEGVADYLVRVSQR